MIIEINHILDGECFSKRDDLVKLNSLLESPELIKYFSKDFLDEGLQRTEDKGLLAIKNQIFFIIMDFGLLDLIKIFLDVRRI